MAQGTTARRPVPHTPVFIGRVDQPDCWPRGAVGFCESVGWGDNRHASEAPLYPDTYLWRILDISPGPALQQQPHPIHIPSLHGEKQGLHGHLA